MCATQILNFGLCDILEQVSGVLFHVFVVAGRVRLLQFWLPIIVDLTPNAAFMDETS